MKARGPTTEQLKYAWHNRQIAGAPVRVGAVIKALVAAEGLDKPSPLSGFCSIWEELVGPELSSHSSPQGLRRGTLQVVVDSAAHLTELKALVGMGLAEQLTARLEEHPIKAIRLKLEAGGRNSKAHHSRAGRSKGKD